MRVKLFGRLPQPSAADPAETTASASPWTLPVTRQCRGVQLMHIGQVFTCIDHACLDPGGPHTVSFRCIVMANPCPHCGAEAWKSRD